MSNYVQLLQSRGMSKVIVSHGFISPDEPIWNPSLGLVTHVCAEQCVLSLWLFTHLIAALTMGWNPCHPSVITSQGSMALVLPARGNKDLMIEKLLWPKRAPCQSVWTGCIWTCGAKFHKKTWSSGKTSWQMPFSLCEVLRFFTLLIQKAVCYHTGNPGFVFLPLLRTCYLFSWFLDS